MIIIVELMILLVIVITVVIMIMIASLLVVDYHCHGKLQFAEHWPPIPLQGDAVQRSCSSILHGKPIMRYVILTCIISCVYNMCTLCVYVYIYI